MLLFKALCVEWLRSYLFLSIQRNHRECSPSHFRFSSLITMLAFVPLLPHFSFMDYHWFFFFFFLLLSGTGTPPLNLYIISLLYPSKIEYYQKAPSIKKSLLGTLNSNNTCGFKYYVISYFVKIKIKKFISL